MADQQPEPPSTYHQSNAGGTFIGRDNYGTINHEIDAKTRAILARLAVVAPDLASLLRQGLRDGFISSDVALTIESAARKLNWDVAEALLIASRNINMEVAEQLRLAALAFSSENVDKIAGAVNRLETAAGSLRTASATARDLKAVVQTVTDLGPTVTALSTASSEIQSAAQQTYSHTSRFDDWTWHSFRWGMGWGAISCAIFTIAVLALWVHAHK